MSSKTRWTEDYMMNTRVIQAHESFVDMINGRKPFNLYDAIQFGYTIDEEANSSDASDDWNTSSGHSYCGLSRNFLQRPSSRITEVTKTRPVSSEAIRKAEKSAAELIEEEERLKMKAEKKRLKKLRQKEKKRLEKENANNTTDKQNEGDDEKKNQNTKEKSSSDAGAGCNSDSSTEEEDDTGSTSSEKKRPVKKKILPNHENNYNKTNVDKQSTSYNETVSSKEKKLSQSHPEKGQEYVGNEEEGKQSDLEELDMSSCFVSNAAAAFAKRQLEKTKEKKEKKDKKYPDSGKESPKPTGDQQNNKVDQKEVTPLSTQNLVLSSEKSPADLIARSMELAFIGNQYAATGNLEMAIKFFTEAIMHNPREYKLFGNRSFCFEKMQQYEKSLMDANVALSMNPQWIKGLYRKGRALTGLKRYMEAVQVYKEVLMLDSSCTDAAQELMKVQILQLVEMGFSKEQSTNAMIIYGSVEKALDALSGLQGSYIPVKPNTQDWVQVEKRSQSPKPVTGVGPAIQQPVALFQPKSQTPPPAPIKPKPVNPELFPVWVGCPSHFLSDAFIFDLFNEIGPVHSVRVLRNKGCAFVNYIHKEDGEKAIKVMHGYIVDSGIPLVVRLPDRIPPHLGMSKTAITERYNKLPNECYFWRTTGCVKIENCQYRHIPENKGIDRNKVK